MTRDEAEAAVRTATEAYAAAKRGVSHQRFAAQNCMPNTLAFAEMVEYTAHQNWLRAHERLASVRPAPSPVIAAKLAPAPTPKPVAATPATVAPAADAKTTANNAGSFDLLGHLNDRCDASENRWRRMYGLLPRRDS